MRYLFVILFLVFSVSDVLAAPHLETREFDSRNILNPPYGFVMNQKKCVDLETVVVEALYQAAQDVRVRCVMSDVYYNGITYQRVWSLKGTFRVLVE